MPQTTQIVPKYSFPYVETIVNDNTKVTDIDPAANTDGDNSVYFLFPFASPKGIDNTFVKITSQDAFVQTFGKSNYKKYGQPMMMPYHVLENPLAVCWCMRVMPENARYSNAYVDLELNFVKAANASESKMYVTTKVSNFVYTDDTSKTETKEILSVTDGTDGVQETGTKLTIPKIMAFCSTGRGKYGDNYSVRVSRDVSQEKEYGIKMYNFEIMSKDNGVQKIASYVGSPITSSKYIQTTFISDLVEDADPGKIPVYVRLSEDKFEYAYDKYVEFVKGLSTELDTEYTTKFEALRDKVVAAKGFSGTDEKASNETVTTELNAIIAGTKGIPEKYSDEIRELISINTKKRYAANIPSMDEFDLFFGKTIATNNDDPFIKPTKKLTEDVDTNDENYNENEYTTDDKAVYIDDVIGVYLSGGTEGYFDNPRKVSAIDPETGLSVQKQNTFADELEDCYKKAWSGDLDRRILSSKRIKADAIFDANYPMSVKNIIADLTLIRNDSMFYADAGLLQNLSTLTLPDLITDFASFQDYKLSKNIQCYYVKEPSSMKRVMVTVTYLMAYLYASHITAYGPHIPFVNDYCRLSGHIRNTLYPTIDDYDAALKEQLAENRFNYFETVDDNLYRRAIQNTCEPYTSDLLEENNVRTMLTLKRGVERILADSTYNFADYEERQRLKTVITDKYRSWINNRVYSFDIEFKTNKFEQERAIIHAYLAIVFRPLGKRTLLEIDINPRTYDEEEEQ